MITSEFKNNVDRIWDAFWSGGITNRLEVLEQITYLLLIRRFDDPTALQDGTGQADDDLHWSRLRETEPNDLYEIMGQRLFPQLGSTGGIRSGYAQWHLQDAQFTIPSPALLARVVDLLDGIPAGDRDAEREFYDYLLSKVTMGSRNGQFGTPMHIVRLMVEMMAPNPDDIICDPACGTAGFLVAASDHLCRSYPDMMADAQRRKHFHESMFHGLDHDRTMLQISGMNLLLHGVEQPDLRQQDSLAADGGGDVEQYSLVLTDPPFAGSRDLERTSDDLIRVAPTRKTELLFLAAVLRLLKLGGRAAVIVPEGVLFGSTRAHIEMRRILVEEHKLEGVVKLPTATFRPYAAISTAILIFTKTNGGGTDHVWFYEVTADGWSPDDRRTPLLAEDRLGPAPRTALTDDEHSANNLPDVLARWPKRASSERKRDRTEQSFVVSRQEIVSQGYNLSLQHYRERHEQQRLVQEKARRLGEFAMVFPGWVPAADIDGTTDHTVAPKAIRVLHPSLLGPNLPRVEDLPFRRSTQEPKRRLRSGDIVGRDLASARHWTVLPGDYEGVQAAHGLVVIRTTDDAVPAEYLAEYLSSPQAERQFPRYGTIPRIRTSGLAEILIPSCDGDPRSIKSAIARMREGLTEARKIQSMLDESRAKVFENCSSTERRARLEEAAELSLLTAQNLRKQRQPYRVFQEAYPYGIARAVRRLLHSASMQDRHEAAIQCAESLILSLGILSLALAADRGWRDLPEVAAWSESMERGGVSLGHWLGVIRAAGAFARSSHDEAAGLAGATATRKGGKGLISDLEFLVALRNKVRHGAGPRTQAEVEKSLKNLEPVVFRSLAASSFLAQSNWVYPTKLRWLPETDDFRISGLAIMGDHPDFEPVEFDATRPLADGRLYIVSQSGEPIPLAPFCVLADCPSCLTPELYHPDRLGRSTAILKSLDRGHELESSAVFSALRSWMNP